MIFCQEHTLTANYLPRELHQEVKQMLGETEEAITEEILRFPDYNKSLGAKQLDLTRSSLDRRLKKLANS